MEKLRNKYENNCYVPADGIIIIYCEAFKIQNV
jgi:hypothetical protein